MPLAPDPELLEESRPVDLGVAWESRAKIFRSSLRALFERSVSTPGGPADNLPLRVTWIRGRVPGLGLIFSALCHLEIVLLLSLPMWQRFDSGRARLAPVRIDVTWYAAPRDLPLLSPPLHHTKLAVPHALRKTLTRQGADAYHPRQTILSLPAHLTHPRQTLIRPDAPSTPPVIAPHLPNIVEWARTMPRAIPAPRFSAPVAVPRRRVRQKIDAAIPDVANNEKIQGPLNIASSPALEIRPALAMNPHVAPVARRPKAKVEEPATNDLGPYPTGGDASLRRLIALSATPAPPAPIIKVPEGNLSARVVISPDAIQPGLPGGSPTGPVESAASADVSNSAKGIPGPPGVSISAGNASASSSISGLSPANSAAPGAAHSINARSTPLPSIAPERAISSRARIPPESVDANLPPEKILSGRQVYTLHVNMPNLTSATGSWILNFSQLRDALSHSEPFVIPRNELAGPVPLRKVDPKYPPQLVDDRVEGEVVLYAIIRKDGSVDSIQVVRSLDPQLDQNAMEALAHWRFRPASRNGVPVELETVVHVPFRATAVF